MTQLKAIGHPENVLIDCSHNNSMKKQRMQPFVWRNVIDQRYDGNTEIIGLMLESNLFEGNQPLGKDLSKLKYGVSITDECISWETTKELILDSRAHLN